MYALTIIKENKSKIGNPEKVAKYLNKSPAAIRKWFRVAEERSDKTEPVVKICNGYVCYLDTELLKNKK